MLGFLVLSTPTTPQERNGSYESERTVFSLEPLNSCREKLSAVHFQEFVQYLSGLQQNGVIQAFEPLFLKVHGGNLSGFVVIRAEMSKLDALVATKEWET
jgi:hypothetical protein